MPELAHIRSHKLRTLLFIPLLVLVLSTGIVGGLSYASTEPPPQRRAGVVWEIVGVNLKMPTGMAVTKDGDVYFNELLTGQTRLIINNNLLKVPFAEFNASRSGSESGLLGLALDPNFEEDSYVYVFYTYQSTECRDRVDDVCTEYVEYNRVVRLRRVFNLGVIVGVEPTVLIDRIPAGLHHNGGILKFGPDGKLWITTGDNGGKYFPQTIAQDPSSLAGKVLRINKDGTIPEDNPIPGSSIYTLGHRNVFGIAFHPETGEPYVTENGPNSNDEINKLIPGANYGWPYRLGYISFPNQSGDIYDSDWDPYLLSLELPERSSDTGAVSNHSLYQASLNGAFVDPIRAYVRAVAPTGADFYTGKTFPEYSGRLIYGDFVTGSIRVLTLEPPDFTKVSSEEIVGMQRFRGVINVVDGDDGNLYVATGNAILRLRRTYPLLSDRVIVANDILTISVNSSSKITDLVYRNSTLSFISTGVNWNDDHLLEGKGEGFAEVTIPLVLTRSPFTVTLNGREIDFSLSVNNTQSTISLRYDHPGKLGEFGVPGFDWAAYQSIPQEIIIRGTPEIETMEDSILTTTSLVVIVAIVVALFLYIGYARVRKIR